MKLEVSKRRIRRRAIDSTLLLGILFASGCSGSIKGNGDSSGNPSDPNDPSNPSNPDNPDQSGPPDGPGAVPLELCKKPGPGKLAMRRLTERQYNNTINTLFAGSAGAVTGFPASNIHAGFRTYAEVNTVTADGAEDIADAATNIARKLTGNLNGLLGCTPGTAPNDPCVTGYIAKLARGAYRRPATGDEVSILNKLYADLRGRSFTQAESVAAVIEATLQSPQFLYVSEVSSDPSASAGSVKPLTDHEIATRLSYALWDDMPDQELARLADAGSLHTTEQVEEQARRLIADKRAEPLFAQFVEDWLQLYRGEGKAKDAKAYPEWNAALNTALRTELVSFVGEVAFRGDGLMSTLFSAPWTMANSSTAKVYSKSAPGATFGKVELDPAQRAGILTSGAFLSTFAGSVESLPVLRGITVRRQILCNELELPPNAMVTSPVPDPNVSVRQQFEQHSSNPACAACHAYIDPIGFGLENYDAIGRWRVTEGNNIPINAKGELVEAGDASGAFEGGAELGAKLAKSTTARECFSRQMFSFLNAQHFDEEADHCGLAYVGKRFADSGGDLRELLVAIVTSDPFLYRLIPERGAK